MPTITTLIRAAHSAGGPSCELPMTALQRRRARQLLVIDGREIGIALAPGTLMQPGDQLVDTSGERYVIRAALERVLRIRADSAWALTQAAYHLGNRHVPIEIGSDYLAIEPDPVLAEMVQGLGLCVSETWAPFAPESGAYGGGHRHGHDISFADDYRVAQAVYALHQADGKA